MSRPAALASGSGLPPTFPLRGFEGSFAEYIDHLYWQYTAMVRDPGITLWGKPIVPSGGPAADGRDSCFWHLLTDSYVPAGEPRRFSLARAESLPHTWAVLEMLAAGDPRAWWWRDPSGALHAAARHWTHEAVLTERRRTFVLLTGYPVGDLGRALEREAREAWASALHEQTASEVLFRQARGLMGPTPAPRTKPDIPPPADAAFVRALAWM